jgi:hypothetical protein
MMTKEEFQNALKKELCYECSLKNRLCNADDESLLNCIRNRCIKTHELDDITLNTFKKYALIKNFIEE